MIWRIVSGLLIDLLIDLIISVLIELAIATWSAFFKHLFIGTRQSIKVSLA